MIIKTILNKKKKLQFFKFYLDFNKFETAKNELKNENLTKKEENTRLRNKKISHQRSKKQQLF